MTFQLTTYAALYGITALAMVLISLYVWRVRRAPGGWYFIALLWAGAFWALGNALEMAAVGTADKVFLGRITYLGIVSIAPLWLLFNLAYSQRSRFIDRRIMLALLVVPAIFIALVFTNDWHHLIWTSYMPVTDSPGAVLIYGYGPGILINIVYSYILMLAGTYLLVRTSLKTSAHFSGQTITLIVAAFLTPAANMAYFIWMSDLTSIDPTPFSVCATGLVLAWSVFRYQLFDLVPVAREAIITDMIDGVVVLDDRDRIIDLNPAARQLFGTKIAAGEPLAAILRDWPELKARYGWLGEESAEVWFDRQGVTRWFDVHVDPLLDNMGNATGKIMILQDITRRHKDEVALHESRENLEALFDTVDDLVFVTDRRGLILEANSAVFKRLGYGRDEVVGRDISQVDRTRPLETTISLINDVLDGRSRVEPTVFTARDGATVQVETRAARGRWNGRPAIFGISRDIGEFTRNEEMLRRSNASLSEEIEERRQAERRTQRSLREKEVLLKEIHHRVKNNMQIIVSMLNLQKGRESLTEISAALSESQSQVMSLALVHEKLYRSGDLSHINFAEYLESLTAQLRRARRDNHGVRLALRIDPAPVEIDLAIPCGFIVNQLVSNSFKHAFPDGRAGTIEIVFTREAGLCKLVVQDDGVGLPPGLDIENSASLGLQLVRTLAGRIGGSLTLDRTHGVTFAIEFEERRSQEKVTAPTGPEE